MNTTSDLEIREALEADLPAILNLYAQPSFNGSSCSPETAASVFGRMTGYPFYKLYVAEKAETIIATYTLLVQDNIARNATPSAIIESVVVAECARGMGVGEALMRHAFESASAQGAYKICLFTGSPDERVHNFYRKLGFDEHGVSYLLRLPERRVA